MKIALMLRSLDEKGGIGVYTRYLVEELLALDRRNEYLLLYRNPSNLGRFSRYDNVRERVLTSRSKALWDQVHVPYACWRERVDVVFHPKFTVPLAAPCRTVMVLHGADWFIPEYARFYKRLDVAYIRVVMPLYCRRATRILSVSQLTTDHFNRILRLPAGKVRTVYFGAGRHFRRISDPGVLERVRERYGLPERFILSLAKYGDGGRKNIEGVLRGYERLHGRVPHKLVIGGKDCHRFRDDHAVPETGWGADVLFPGWIDQEDLPALYSLAELYLYPSNLEAFPIPITEAMACGTPIVTSRVNGLEEIAGPAALRVDPADHAGIAEASYRLLTDSSMRDRLSAAGQERTAMFRWEKCARETLEVLEGLAGDANRRRMHAPAPASAS